MKVEYDRWKYSDESSVVKVKKLFKDKKNKFTIPDWITCMQSYGVAADKVSEIIKVPVPLNLYSEIALKQERTAKKLENILYNTTHLPETENLYYKDHTCMKFDAKIIEVFKNVKQNNLPNILIFDKSAIYPTSGGQEHDTGTIKIAGCAGEYKIVDAIKVGKCVLHIIDRPLEGYVEMFKGKKVTVTIDPDRRH